MTAGKPVTVRGVTYPSRSAAARALGVTNQTVGRAANCGNVDRLGRGRGPSGKATIIRGQTYSSRSEAARAMGCSDQKLKRHLSAGTLDDLGFHGGRGLVSFCDLDPLARATLVAAAEKRKISPAALAVAVFITVLDDTLIDAILDDGGAA